MILPAAALLLLLGGRPKPQAASAQDHRGLVQPLHDEARQAAAQTWPKAAQVALQAVIASNDEWEPDGIVPQAVIDWKLAFAEALALPESPDTEQIKAAVEIRAVNHISRAEPNHRMDLARRADAGLDRIWANVLWQFSGSPQQLKPDQVLAAEQEAALRIGHFPCETASLAVSVLMAEHDNRAASLQGQYATAGCNRNVVPQPAQPAAPSALAREVESVGALFDGPAVYAGVSTPTKAQLSAALQTLRAVQAGLRQDSSLWTGNLAAVATMPYDFDELGKPGEASTWSRIVLDHLFAAVNESDIEYSGVAPGQRAQWLVRHERAPLGMLPRGQEPQPNLVDYVASVAWGDFDATLARVRASGSILKPLMLVELARVAGGPRGD
ncbi:MAG: hypothetical protein ACRD1M_17655 [Terriglobales bacterium]